jgi:hypothetical protein
MEFNNWLLTCSFIIHFITKISFELLDWYHWLGNEVDWYHWLGNEVFG